jgi:hypothetical protein
MPQITWKVDRVIDSHVHFLNAEPVPHFYQIMETVNYGAANLMAVPGPKGADQNRWIVERKTERPDFFFVFGCMDHDPEKVAAGDGRYLVAQIDRLMAENFDGLKMLEGKPAVRRSWMPLPLDHKYFHPYWDRVAEIDAPVTLHVSDPIDMWAPGNSAEYHKLDSQNEFLRQAEAILQRHPKLRINFPHFMYLSPQLDRLADLFARYPGVMTDLAMGSEFLYYLSDDVDRARDFFIRWQDPHPVRHRHQRPQLAEARLCQSRNPASVSGNRRDLRQHRRSGHGPAAVKGLQRSRRTSRLASPAARPGKSARPQLREFRRPRAEGLEIQKSGLTAEARRRRERRTAFTTKNTKR